MNNDSPEMLFSKETMNHVLENKFCFDRKYDMEYCPNVVSNNPIDWELNPFGDPEWSYVFNRMEYCLDLCYYYNETKENKYLAKSKELMFDFISKNTVSNNKSLRTLDTGIRLIVWDKCLEFFEQENMLSKDELLQIEQSMKWQMEYLVDAFDTFQGLNNWGMMQSIGFLNALKRVSIDQRYIDFYEDMYENHLDVEYFADGMQWEQSAVYLVEVSERLLQLNNDTYKTEKYYEKLNKAGYALFANADFDGKSLMNGDGDLIDFIGAIQCIAFVTKDDELASLVSKFDLRQEVIIKYGDKPRKYFEAIENKDSDFDMDLDEAMYYMRKTDKSYISLQNGMLGYGHGHFDNLHVNLSQNKTKILVDSGRYSYENTESLRKELKGFSSHNGPYIDNPGLKYLNSWENEGFIETFPIRRLQKDGILHLETSYMPNKDVICTRKVTSINDEITIISDYANADYKVKYKFFNMNELTKNNEEFKAENYKVYVYGEGNIKTEVIDEKISPKYNVVTKTKAIFIEQEKYAKTFSFFLSKDAIVKPYDNFKYFHEKRMFEGEDTYKLFEIKLENKTYIYGENKYINGNCNNALIIDGKTYLTNNFIYDVNNQKMIVLKR